MLTQYNIRNIKLAIFDLDNTILKIDSDYEMVNYLIDKNFILEKYRKINKDYYDLMVEFKKITGVGLSLIHI